MRRPPSVVVIYGPKGAGKSWVADWLLADRLAAAGYGVLRIWVTAPLEVTLDRIAHRLSRKVPVTADEARWIHNEATRRASARSFAAVIETSGLPDTSRLDRLLESLR